MEGVLYKKGKYLGWKKRKFVLSGNTLQCLKPDGRPYKSSTLQNNLEISELDEPSSGKYVFIINSGKTRITLGCNTIQQRSMWVKHLLSLGEKNNTTITPETATVTTTASGLRKGFSAKKLFRRHVSGVIAKNRVSKVLGGGEFTKRAALDIRRAIEKGGAAFIEKFCML